MSIQAITLTLILSVVLASAENWCEHVVYYPIYGLCVQGRDVCPTAMKLSNVSTIFDKGPAFDANIINQFYGLPGFCYPDDALWKREPRVEYCASLVSFAKYLLFMHWSLDIPSFAMYIKPDHSTSCNTSLFNSNF